MSRLEPTLCLEGRSTLLREDGRYPQLPDLWINYSVAARAIAALLRAHRHLVQTGHGSCVVVVGQAGSGKSFLGAHYAGLFPRSDGPEYPSIPVLRVTTPPGLTPRGCAEAVLDALGDTIGPNHRERAMTKRIREYMRLCGVQVALFDEFAHSVDTRKSSLPAISQWLKAFVDGPWVTAITGLPRCLQVVEENVELRRRVSEVVELTPFKNTSDQDWTEYRSVLRRLFNESPAPLPEIHSPELAHRLLYASEGLIDYVLKIINGALRIAHEERTRVTTDTLARAFVRHVWPFAPPHLNPLLAPIDTLRSLRDPGEPFSNWDNYCERSFR